MRRNLLTRPLAAALAAALVLLSPGLEAYRAFAAVVEVAVQGSGASVALPALSSPGLGNPGAVATSGSGNLLGRPTSTRFGRRPLLLPAKPGEGGRRPDEGQSAVPPVEEQTAVKQPAVSAGLQDASAAALEPARKLSLPQTTPAESVSLADQTFSLIHDLGLKRARVGNGVAPSNSRPLPTMAGHSWSRRGAAPLPAKPGEGPARRLAGGEGQRKSVLLSSLLAAGLTAAAATVAFAAGDPSAPALPGPAGQFLHWLNVNFSREALTVFKGATGSIVTFWLMNKATAAARSLLNRSQELTPLQRNLIVVGVGMTVAAVGLGKTLVLMGLKWSTVGTVLGAGALLPVLLPMLTSLFTKGAGPAATQTLANQFAGLMMGLGLDSPFKEGDEIAVTIDGETVKGVVREIQISRTLVEATVRGKTHLEFISNSELLSLKRIGVKPGPESKSSRPGNGVASAPQSSPAARPGSVLDEAQRATEAARSLRGRTLREFIAAHRTATALALTALTLAALPWLHVAVLPLAAVSVIMVGSILLHEVAHLRALRRLGDDTAARHGLTSLNPLKVVDPVWTVLVPTLSLVATGGLLHFPVLAGRARSLPVDFNKLPDPKRDPARVALAGPGVNAAIAALAFGALLLAPGSFVLLTVAKLNLALALFNLIPFPFLDGGKVLVSLLPARVYDRWTRNPNIPEDYQGLYRKLYEGPSNLLTRLHIHDQKAVNRLTWAAGTVLLAAYLLAGFSLLGAPLLFLALPCSYDYYCIREKIQNEQAVNEIRDIMRGMASALAKAAEESEEIQSEIDTYEVEHILKNALEDMIDQVVDSEGFAELDEQKKWDRFYSQYKEAAVEALHKSPKGMSKDSPEAIRKLLDSQAGKEYFEKVRKWIDRNEVWAKWKSPKRKGSLREAVKEAPKERRAGNGVAPASAGEGPRSFEDALSFPDLGLSDKEKAFLLLHLREMKLQRKPPVTGRVDELEEMVDAVTSPRGEINSVILIGKKGVGKTAVAEKLAQAIFASESDKAGTFRLESVQGRFLLKLNLGRLLAGDDPVKAVDALLGLLAKFNDADHRNGSRILLFVDEFHQIFEHPKGSQIANMLKEPLRDGELTLIAATTDTEYKQYLEKDEAFQDRLIPIWIEEATVEQTLRMLQGAKSYYEDTYRVLITPEALESAARDSKYDQELRLPRRAFRYLSLALKRADFAKQRDRATFEIREALSDLGNTAADLSRHLGSKSLVTEDLKKDEPRAIELYNTLVALAKKVVGLYARRAAVPSSGTPVVTDQMVKAEISRKTGVASGQLTMGKESMEKYLKMEETLGARVVGQEEPVHVISNAVRNNKAGLSDPKRPLGVFYLTGPTGTGKTHLAKELARFLFDDPNAVIRMDMSEYMESHSVARMIGSPPGYVGHDAGGQLTEALRKRPYSVILLDEIEKAHPDVWDILLQITGDGRLTDGKGRTVDFKNTIILMTSNLGMSVVDTAPYEKEYADLKAQLSEAKFKAEREALLAKRAELARRLGEETKRKAIEVTDKAFKEIYKPEFRGRLHADPIVFNRISPEMAVRIVDLNLKELASVLAYAGHELAWTPEVAQQLAEEGFSIALGARPLQNTLERVVTQPLAAEILKAAVANGERVQPSAIALSLEQGKVKIAVSPLPPKVVARQEAEEGAARELFTRVLQSVLEAAAKNVAPDLAVETLDRLVTRTPTSSPRLAGRGEGEGLEAVKPFFAENEPLARGPNAVTVTSSTPDPRAKDPALLAARKDIAAALGAKHVPESVLDLLLRTYEDESHPYVGWLKLFITHAKEFTPLPAEPGEGGRRPGEGESAVKVSWSADGSARLVIHRPGQVGEKEAELLKRHFTGSVPASREQSFSKAETWNVMGQTGHEHWLELYRLLSAIPGARLGYASGENGTDYWVELPSSAQSAGEGPASRLAGDEGQRAVAPSSSARPTKIHRDGRIGTRKLKVLFGPDATEESARALLDNLGLENRYSLQRRDSGVSNDWLRWVAIDAMTSSEARSLAGRLAAESLVLEVHVSPRVAARLRAGARTTGPPRSAPDEQASARPAPGTEPSTPEAGPAASAEPFRMQAATARPEPGERAHARDVRYGYEDDPEVRSIGFPISYTMRTTGYPLKANITVYRFLKEVTEILAGGESQRTGVVVHWTVGQDLARILVHRPSAPLTPAEAQAIERTLQQPQQRAALHALNARVLNGSGNLSLNGSGASVWIEIPRPLPAEPGEGPARRMAGGEGQSSLIRPSHEPPTLGDHPQRFTLVRGSDEDDTGDTERLAITHIRSAIQSDGDYSETTALAVDSFFWAVVDFMLRRSSAGLELYWKTEGGHTRLILHHPYGQWLDEAAAAELERLFKPETLEEDFTQRLRVARASLHYGSGLSGYGSSGASVWIDIPGEQASSRGSQAPAEPATRNAQPETPSDLHSMTRQILRAMLRQGEERGPTLRMSLAEALAVLATPSDLEKARDDIRFADSLERHYPEVALAALTIARHGSRAQDSERLARALLHAGRNGAGDLYKPAKSHLVEAAAALEATQAGGVRRLLKRYRDEKAKSGYASPEDDEHWKSARNLMYIDALYLALCRYGDSSVQRVLTEDWENNPKRSEWLYEFFKRENPGLLRRLLAAWRRNGTVPDGYSRMLLLFAIADFGGAEDVAVMEEIVRTQWDHQIEFTSLGAAAEAWARMVARLRAYAGVQQMVRERLGQSLSAYDGFAPVLAAAAAAGEAGGEEDLALLERILRTDPASVSSQHEMTQHEAALAWAKAVNRLGLMPSYLAPGEGQSLGRIFEMLGDRNAIVNKAAVEALKLYFSKRRPRPSSGRSPGEGPARRLAGDEGQSAVPIQPDHPFFARQQSVPEGDHSTFYGSDAEIESNAGARLARLPEESRRLAQQWARVFSRLLHRILAVEFQRDVTLVERRDGGLSIYWVLREAVTSEFTSAQAEAVRNAVLAMLHAIDRSQAPSAADRDASAVLQRLLSLAGARLGLDYNYSRRNTPFRGSMELWLKLDVPPPARAADPGPRFTSPHEYMIDRLDEHLSGGRMPF